MINGILLLKGAALSVVLWKGYSYRFGSGRFQKAAAFILVLLCAAFAALFPMPIPPLLALLSLTLMVTFLLPAHPLVSLFYVLFFETMECLFGNIPDLLWEHVAGFDMAKKYLVMNLGQWDDILAIVLSTLFFLFFMKQEIWDVFRSLSRKRLLSLCFILILLICLIASIEPLVFGEVGSWGRVIIAGICLLAIVSIGQLVFLSLRLRLTLQALDIADREKAQLIEMEKDQYIELSKGMENLRSFRHDYKAHIRTLMSYAEDEDMEKLKEYLCQIQGAYDVDRAPFYTGSLVCDAVLGYYNLKLPNEAFIKVTGRLPSEPFVSDMDLCIIFSNMMRNAVTAVSDLTAVKSIEPKSIEPIGIWVSLKWLPESKKLLLHFENACLCEDESTQISQKSPDEIHGQGIGLSNVKKVVEHYHGELVYQKKDGVFRCEMALFDIR